MRVGALVSGGKDSVLALLLAEQAGHEVVALGHIAPHDERSDSYMFQSAGTMVVQSYFGALFQLPLVVQSSQHHSLNLSADYYKSTEGDEVEDLRQLLQRMKDEFQIDAIVSGAVFSDYQRLRVESVALSMNLFSISPLWHLEQSTILDLLQEHGVTAILVKVCSMGLTDVDLGQPIDQSLRERFENLHRAHGFHIAGEGGEYESLVLSVDSIPRRVVIDDHSVVLCGEDQFLYHIQKCHIEEIKPTKERLKTSNMSLSLIDQDDHVGAVPMASHHSGPILPSYLSYGEYVTKSPVVLAGTLDVANEDNWTSAFDSILTKMSDALTQGHLDIKDLVMVEIQIQDLDHFAAFNREYQRLFQGNPPPARACTQTNLAPCGIRIALYARQPDVPNRLPLERLHVQSLSAWATPCVGPYSQVVFSNQDGPRIAGFSGTIALNSMTLTHLKVDEANGPKSLRLKQLFALAVPILGARLSAELITSLRTIFRICIAIGTSIQPLSGVIIAISAGAIDSRKHASDLTIVAQTIDRVVNTFKSLYSNLKAPIEKGGRLQITTQEEDTQAVIVSSIVFPRLPKDVACEIIPFFQSSFHLRPVVLRQHGVITKLQMSSSEDGLYAVAEAMIIDVEEMKSMTEDLKEALSPYMKGHASVTIFRDNTLNVSDDSIEDIIQTSIGPSVIYPIDRAILHQVPLAQAKGSGIRVIVKEAFM